MQLVTVPTEPTQLITHKNSAWILNSFIPQFDYNLNKLIYNEFRKQRNNSGTFALLFLFNLKY
jgi:hypothetical protein